MQFNINEYMSRHCRDMFIKKIMKSIGAINIARHMFLVCKSTPITLKNVGYVIGPKHQHVKYTADNKSSSENR